MNKLFTDNAFLFLVSRERILKDERLSYVPVELPEELAYIGDFMPITLGEYVDWWYECPWTVHFDGEDKMSLVWFVSKGPGEFENRCLAVDQRGETVMFTASASIPLCSELLKVTARHGERVRQKGVYSLKEAIGILKEEMPSQEVYDRCLGQFYLHSKKAQDEYEGRCVKAERLAAEYKRRWYKAVFRLKKDEAQQLYECIRDYRQIDILADVKESIRQRLNVYISVSRRVSELFPEFVDNRFSTKIDVEGVVSALNEFMENE